MRRLLVGTCLSTAALVAAGAAYANEELIKLSQDPKQWVMPAGNYANTRHSTLKQITADNVGKLQRLKYLRGSLKLTFTLVLTFTTALVFGLAPALFAAGSDVQKSLREGSGRAGAGIRRIRPGGVVVGDRDRSLAPRLARVQDEHPGAKVRAGEQGAWEIWSGPDAD